MANVRLPQIDKRQPKPHNTSNLPKPGNAPAITEPKFPQSSSSAERSNKHVGLDLSELNITQPVVSKNIKVKTPHFTSIDLPAQRHALDTPAALLVSRPSKPWNHHKPGKVEASPNVNHLSARLLRGKGSRAKRSVLRNTSELKRNATNLTSLEYQSRSGRPGRLGRPGIFTASETRGGSGRGSRGKKTSRSRAANSMKADGGARARYEEGPANEKDRTHGASTVRTPITSPQSGGTSATTGSLHLSPSPKGAAHHARHNSSPRQWTDYANHSSNPSGQGAPVRLAPRRSRGGIMSRRALSSFPVPRGAIQRQSTGPVARLSNNWTTWVEIHVVLFRLSPTISTGDLWSSFHDEGNITSIEIFEDSSGSRTGKAKIKFR